MALSGFLWAAIAAAIGGVALLRLSWGRRGRSAGLNGAGWALFGFAAIAGWAAAGAWGGTIAALWGMGAAALLLGHAAVTAPAGKGNGGATARVRMLPEAGEPLYLLRRIVTFVLVVLALPASILLALALRALGDAGGMSEANAIVVALFGAPLAWTILAYWLLVERRRLVQVAILLLAALPGLTILVARAPA